MHGEGMGKTTWRSFWAHNQLVWIKPRSNANPGGEQCTFPREMTPFPMTHHPQESLCSKSPPQGQWEDDVVPCWEVAPGTAWQELGVLGVLPEGPWPGEEAPTQHQQHLLQLPLPGRKVQLLRVEAQLLGPAERGGINGINGINPQGRTARNVTPSLPPCHPWA